MADWRSKATLADHFQRHGGAVGARTIEDYAEMAQQVIATGTRFTFHHPRGERHGYYHKRTHGFVVVDPVADEILSLDRKSERHVSRLPDSTYLERRR